MIHYRQPTHWNDCKQILRHLIKHNTEAHESAAKAGKELMALLEYFPISEWLQVADATTRPLVYIQVPEVVEIVKQVQAVIDKKKLKEGELPIKEIVDEQNLHDMMLLRHVWVMVKMMWGRKPLQQLSTSTSKKGCF